jgi:hypothetical protein
MALGAFGGTLALGQVLGRNRRRCWRRAPIQIAPTLPVTGNTIPVM